MSNVEMRHKCRRDACAKMISQHDVRINLKTIIPICLIGMIFLACVAGMGVALYLAIGGRALKTSDGVILFCGGGIVALGSGVALVRFLRRMLLVRRVLLHGDDRIEIVTWGNRTFTARLPADIEHMLLVGDYLTVTFRIEKRRFVVDTEQFTDKEGVNQFLRQFLGRYRDK